MKQPYHSILLHLTAPLLALAQTMFPPAQAQTSEDSKTADNQAQVVVFVCEHGAAKSVVAAAFFNKLASERHLGIRAIARGTNPQADIAVSAEKGLQSDGLSSTEQKPKGLTKDDVSKAVKVVTFCALPQDYKAANVEEWDDVPTVGEGYETARDVIVVHLRRLLDELATRKK